MPHRAADLIEPELLRRFASATRRPFVLGIAGAQGSGKSTLARLLAERLRSAGTACAVLSLDDLYFERTARRALAERVHPLFATRGVPGTHDVAAGLALIEALGRGEAVGLPRFDKARDEAGEAAPPQRAEVLILEGWCLGARPQAEIELAEPVNTLERECDPDGIWRRYADRQLAGAYCTLWDRIDFLVLLAAPGFDVVARWRIEQEHALRRERLVQGQSIEAIMSDNQVRTFVEHYQRLTQHLLRHGEDWADVVIRLDSARQPVARSDA